MQENIEIFGTSTAGTHRPPYQKYIRTEYINIISTT